MPAPAPCATTMVAIGDRGRAYVADTVPFIVSMRSVSSGPAIACHDAHDGRHPPPGHLGVLLRRLETRRLLSRRAEEPRDAHVLDRKSTRLNSSHSQISYAVFCL